MDKKAILAKHLGKLRNKYEKNITWTVRCDVCRTGICESGICISCLEAEELLDQILTAHTSEDEPTCYLVKCDWKTAYLELAKMVDKQLTAHTEPEDDVCPICKGGKKLYFCPTCFPEQEDK